MNDNLNIKYKAELTSFVKNQYSKYPTINVKNGETRLEEISKNQPKFILEAIDKNKKLNNKRKKENTKFNQYQIFIFKERINKRIIYWKQI